MLTGIGSKLLCVQACDGSSNLQLVIVHSFDDCNDLPEQLSAFKSRWQTIGLDQQKGHEKP